MSSATVSDKPPSSLRKRSVKTAVSNSPQPPSSNADGEKQMADKIQDLVIRILSTIQRVLISIINFFYNLYLVLKFVWEKPDIAWDLVSTTFHLIKVSRDAGLWSWSQLWDIFYTQTFAPMIRAESQDSGASEADKGQ